MASSSSPSSWRSAPTTGSPRSSTSTPRRRPPISVFESGAILQYLAEKTGRLLPKDPRRRVQAIEWMYWQYGQPGPDVWPGLPFPQLRSGEDRVRDRALLPRAARLYGVLDERLASRRYVAEEFSMADILCWPWIHLRDHHGQSLDERPHLRRWYEDLLARPSFQRGLAAGVEMAQAQAGGPRRRSAQEPVRQALSPGRVPSNRIGRQPPPNPPANARSKAGRADRRSNQVWTALGPSGSSPTIRASEMA